MASTNELFREFGAGKRARTADLLITNQLLYQLSYAGLRRDLKLSRSAETVNSAVASGLQFKQRRVTAFRTEQFVVRTELRDFAVDDHRNAIGNPHR